jgi:hypothetical protein
MQATVQRGRRDADVPRGGDKPARDDGTRRCIVSGETLPRDRLLRFVAGPDGIVVPDLAERLPGRGLWLRARRDIVEAACSRNQFSRAARRTVTPMAGPNGEPLDRLVEVQLVRRCLDVVSLARRAGIAVAGFDQVRQWLKARPPRTGAGPALLLNARDAAAGGREKLAALAGWDDGVAVPVVHCGLLTARELGRAFGRDHLVHVLIEPHRLAGRLLTETGRLAGFRDEGTGSRDGTAEDAVASTEDDRSD